MAEEAKFHIGDKVKMNDKYYVCNADRDRIFEVMSEPWMCCGTEVVALYGKAGGYAVDGLDPVNVETQKHGKWINTREHDWEKDDKGRINMFAIEYGYHNGPYCEICGKAVCEHCEPDWASTECEPHFICSECGRHEEKRHDFCRCGAKMDGKEENNG